MKDPQQIISKLVQEEFQIYHVFEGSEGIILCTTILAVVQMLR